MLSLNIRKPPRRNLSESPEPFLAACCKQSSCFPCAGQACDGFRSGVRRFHRSSKWNSVILNACEGGLDEARMFLGFQKCYLEIGALVGEVGFDLNFHELSQYLAAELGKDWFTPRLLEQKCVCVLRS